MNKLFTVHDLEAAASLFDIDGDLLAALIERLNNRTTTIHVVVIHEGGRVRNAMSSTPVSVTVIDYDRDGTPEDLLTEVPQEGGGVSLAIVEDTNTEPLDEHWQDFVEWWEHESL